MDALLINVFIVLLHFVIFENLNLAHLVSNFSFPSPFLDPVIFNCFCNLLLNLM